ncbi:MAG: mechanosensitive ion channel family protein [Candidatus Puniceispirillales bacterium WSBS_2018_MAG_OTU23]
MDISFLNDAFTLSDYELILTLLGNVFSGILILAIGVFVSRQVSRTIRKHLDRLSIFDPTLVPLIASLGRYTVLIIAVVATLGSFGIQTTSIIAVLGAAGLAIGLALQGTLSNVAAGVMVLFLRPFQAGDWIETGSNSGTVSEVGLFTTTITTFDNVFISVPNSSIWGSTIINHSRNNTRRMDIDIGISYKTDLDHAEKSLLAMASDERILSDPKPQFLVVRFDDSAVVVRLRLYAPNDVYWGLYWDMMRRVKPALDTANIEIPFPQRDYRLIASD